MRKSAASWAFLLLTGLLLVEVVLYFYLGSFTPMLLDDFCLDADVANLGAIGAIDEYYTKRTGRLTEIFLFVGAYYLGPRSTAILPPLLLGVLFVAVFATVRRLISTQAGKQTNLASLLFTAAIFTTVLRASPGFPQAVYWRIGIFAYLVPLILLTAYVYLLCVYPKLKSKLSQTAAVASTVVFCFLLGMSQEFLALCVVLTLVPLIAGVLSRKFFQELRPVITLLIAGLCFVAIGLFIILVAPGNAARSVSTLGQQPELIPSVILAFKFMLVEMGVWALAHLWHLLALFILGLLAAKSFFVRTNEDRFDIAQTGLAVDCCVGYIVLGYVIVAYALQSPAPFRMVFLFVVMMSITALLLAFQLSKLEIFNWDNAVVTLVVVLLLSAVSLAQSWRLFGLVPAHQQYARQSQELFSRFNTKRGVVGDDFVIETLTETGIDWKIKGFNYDRTMPAWTVSCLREYFDFRGNVIIRDKEVEKIYLLNGEIETRPSGSASPESGNGKS